MTILKTPLSNGQELVAQYLLVQILEGLLQASLHNVNSLGVDNQGVKKVEHETEAAILCMEGGYYRDHYVEA